MSAYTKTYQNEINIKAKLLVENMFAETIKGRLIETINIVTIKCLSLTLLNPILFETLL